METALLSFAGVVVTAILTYFTASRTARQSEKKDNGDQLMTFMKELREEIKNLKDRVDKLEDENDELHKTQTIFIGHTNLLYAWITGGMKWPRPKIPEYLQTYIDPIYWKDE